MNNASTFAVILAAAGKSSRFIQGETPETAVRKPFVPIHGKPVWLYSAERFRKRDDVRQLIIVVSPDDEDWFREFYAEEIDRLLLEVVPGGAERADSVQNALKVVGNEIGYVAIHDAARPCVRDATVDAVFERAKTDGAAIPAAPLVGTVKQVRENCIERTVPRENLWEAQTPQVFRRKILVDAFSQWNAARRTDTSPTDDAAVVEQAGYDVFIVSSDRWNIKITTQTDLTIAAVLLSGQNNENGDDL